MKAIYTLVLGCFCVGVTLAQSDIASVEYYFNTDPGIGNGTHIDFDPNVEIVDQNFNIPTTGLSVGNHKLFIRVVNADGNSSLYAKKHFRIQDVPTTNTADIVEAEYYFNTDPGIGNGTAIDVSDVDHLDENLLISTSGLPIGTHRLFIRVKNSHNDWSLYTRKTFRVADAPYSNSFDIVEAEYYFNTDPGFGNGTTIDVVDIDHLDENLLVSTSGLPIGTHRLFIRVKNSNDDWSMYTRKTFRVSDIPFINNASIVAAEYFIDVDPGFGNGTAVDISGDDIDEDFVATTTSSLAQGDHFLYIRVLNADNTWSLYTRESFEVDGTLGLDTELLASIKFFPNPTSDILNISIPAGNQITKAVIYDTNGREVFRQEHHLENIRMSNFQNGIYLLQLETAKGAISKKIIKN